MSELGLCCCARAISSCSKWGATLHCSVQASHCGGLSCCRAWALGAQASVVAARRLSSCGSRALERRLSSGGAWAWLLCSMWDLPDQGSNRVPCIGRQILNHCGTREVPQCLFKGFQHMLCFLSVHPNQGSHNAYLCQYCRS